MRPKAKRFTEAPNSIKLEKTKELNTKLPLSDFLFEWDGKLLMINDKK
jgi:hypothetical protein